LRYSKEKCVICDRPFEPADDIVVCPDCGSPHHRECWQEKGACGNAHLHKKGFVWQATAEGELKNESSAEQAGLVCPVCKAQNESGASVCSYCGNKFPDQNVSSHSEVYEPPVFYSPAFDFSDKDMIGGISAKDLALYVQIGVKRYLEKFRKIDADNKRTDWSWAAFFFTPYWFFYRKMYWAGGVFLGLTFAMSLLLSSPLSQIQQLMANMPPASAMTPADFERFYAALADNSHILLYTFALTLVVRVAAALFAVPLYKNKATKDIHSIKRFTNDSSVSSRMILRRGGVSGFSLLAGVLFYDLLWTFVDYIAKRL